MFDHQKLEHLNGLHIRAAVGRTSWRSGSRRFLEERGSALAAQPDLVRAATPLVQEKIKTLAEFEPYCAFLFGDVEYDEAAWERLAGDAALGRHPGRHGEALGARRRLAGGGHRAGPARRRATGSSSSRGWPSGPSGSR